jgi:hypothetical protein
MTTINAFNTLLKNFLEELAATFPEESRIDTAVAAFDTVVAVSPRKTLDIFMQAMSPHADLLMAKNNALFSQPIDLGGLDITKIWAKEDVSQATRDAIWQYLHTLFVLGTTVSSLPQSLLTTIESIANDAAEKMQSGNPADLAGLASQLMNSAGGLDGLFGALSAKKNRKV